MTTEPIISITAAAAAIGISRQALGRQIKAGLVRRHSGGVRLSEVKADRARNLDPSAAARHARERRPRTSAREPRFDIGELCKWLGAQTFAAIGKGATAKGRIRLPHLGVAVAPAEADELLAACRAGDLPAIRRLHRRLAPDA